MLLGTLGASLLRNLVTGRGTKRASEGIVRAGYGRPLSSTSQNNMDFYCRIIL